MTVLSGKSPALRLFALVLFLGGSASAADQAIVGKKLVIKNPLSGTANNRVLHLAKDPNINVGIAGSAGDPQCSGAGGGGTSSLRIVASGGAGDITIPLPCGGWTTNGTNNLYRYRDTSGASCMVVVVKDGVLAKAVCKGSQVGIDLNGSMSPVTVVTTLNSEQYCTEFGGSVVKDGSDDKTFLRKGALAPVGCPTTTTTSTPPTTSTTTSTSTTSTSTSSTSTSSTSTTTSPIPTTTSTTLTVCCDYPSACAAGDNAAGCIGGGGAVAAYGTVCDSSGDCVAPPGTPGSCCAFGNSTCQTNVDAEFCAIFSGEFHASSVCLPSGACSP
jgi:hypothetical protein